MPPNQKETNDMGNKLEKVVYNRIDKEGWIEIREALDYREHPLRSTFLNLEALEYSEKPLLDKPVSQSDTTEPIPFVDVGIIDF